MSNVCVNLPPKRNNFTMVDNLLLEFGVRACGDKARVLLLIMLMRYDRALNGNPVYPSAKRLACQLALSTRQITRHLKALAEKEFISITSRWEADHRRNYYVVNYACLKDALQQLQAESSKDHNPDAQENEDEAYEPWQ